MERNFVYQSVLCPPRLTLIPFLELDTRLWLAPRPLKGDPTIPRSIPVGPGASGLGPSREDASVSNSPEVSARRRQVRCAFQYTLVVEFLGTLESIYMWTCLSHKVGGKRSESPPIPQVRTHEINLEEKFLEVNH